MRVRLKRDWRGLRSGSVAELGDGVANVLIRRGVAKEAKIKDRRAQMETTRSAGPREKARR